MPCKDKWIFSGWVKGHLLRWVQGRSALFGSRGNAHWQVKGGSHCPGRVGACANSYWVLPDAIERRFAAKLHCPFREILKKWRSKFEVNKA